MKNAINQKKHLFSLRRGISLVALMLSSALSGCESLCGEPDILPCGTQVTVVGAGCASGAFESLWLQLDNGELLQPFENQTSITSIKEGERYMIGYEKMKRDKRYDHQLACLALPPKGTPIRLLCMNPIEEEPTGNCSTIVTARTVECSSGTWGTTWLQLEDGSYLQPWNNATNISQLTPGAKYKIGYKQMAKDNRFNNGAVCAAMPSDQRAWTPTVVSVECMEPVGGN